MPYTTLVAGTTITASWANANVRDQGIPVFATAAARDAAITSPIEGMHAYTSDTNSLWFYTGTAWLFRSGPPPRFRVVGGGAGQTGIAHNTATTFTWANGTEVTDTEGAIASGVFTCPAALAGRWHFDFATLIDPDPDGFRLVWLESSVGPTRYAEQIINAPPAGIAANQAGSAEIVLSAGATVVVRGQHFAGENRTANTSANQYFQGRYVGPA